MAKKFKVTITAPTRISGPEGDSTPVKMGQTISVSREDAFKLRQAQKCAFNEKIPESDNQDAAVFGPHVEECEAAKAAAKSGEQAHAEAAEAAAQLDPRTAALVEATAKATAQAVADALGAKR